MTTPDEAAPADDGPGDETDRLQRELAVANDLDPVEDDRPGSPPADERAKPGNGPARS